MPDLMLVHMQICSKGYGLQSFDIGGYHQEINFDERTPYHLCTCKGYQYGRKIDKFYGRSCKHLEEAHKQCCTYMEQIDGSPKRNGICPKCGEKTVTVRVGV